MASRGVMAKKPTPRAPPAARGQGSPKAAGGAQGRAFLAITPQLAMSF